MSPKSQSERADANRLQDAFLAAARGTPVTLFLVNGVRLQGAVALEDRHTLLLVNEGAAQLVYKHAVAANAPLFAIEVAPLDAEPADAASDAAQPIDVAMLKGQPT
jgi:host factor-I protein